MWSDLDLELRVLGEQPLPVVKILACLNELSQAHSAGAQQHPAAHRVDVHELGNAIWLQVGEPCGQRRLEAMSRRHGLEEELTLRRRDAENGRPPAHMRLLDLADDLS